MLGAVQATLLVPVGPIAYLYDTFTDTNMTLLGNHTPEVNKFAGGWVPFNTADPAGIYVNNGEAQGQPYGIDTGGTGTYIVTAVIRGGFVNPGGILARGANTINTFPTAWCFGFSDWGTKLSITEFLGNTYIVRASVAATAIASSRCVVTWSGDTATLAYAGVSVSYSCPSKGQYWGGSTYTTSIKLEVTDD